MQGLDYTRRMDFVSVRAGWFWMGWGAGHASERPLHRVWTGAFAVSRTPVTNREYAPFLAAARRPSPPAGRRRELGRCGRLLRMAHPRESHRPSPADRSGVGEGGARRALRRP